MLYPKSTEKNLSPELFRHPGSEYRGAPFWAWNCELDRGELLWQLEVLKEMGLGGAHMHVRTGMATPYLSDEHMALVRACVEKCKQESMLAWLYDEDRWPSGAAGGLLTKDPKYRARHLLLTIKPYSQASAEDIQEASARTGRSENGTLLACYDVRLDENGCLAGAARIDENAPAQGRKWYAYVETDRPNPWYNNQTYANTLDPATIQRFVEIAYERYLETVGEDFGGAVPAIFTDEPQFSHKTTLSFAQEEKDVMLPWTDDLPETFRAAYGEELVDHLPELLWELPDGKISVVRYHYHDHIAERFAEAFADTCGRWCGEHGLMLTGHMMEEPTLCSQTAALGETMRSYRSFQLPGIDMLCARFELTTAKQAQSAVHQYGRCGMTSELYGVTGWDFDFRGHKIHGDWQAALGVTVRVQHLSWVSMKGEAKRDYPASISYQSPWWRDYSYVEDHFARLNTALTRGKPVVRVGVIHPVESYWLHWGPAEQTYGVRQQLDEHFQSLTDWLLNGGIDFDFISESLLPSQCEKAGAPLQVGEMAYDAVVVPGCETLRATTLERLEAFQKAGGRLIFLGNAPSYTDAKPDDRGAKLYAQSQRAEFSQEAVLTALESVRLIDVRNEDGTRTDNLVHQLRRDGDGLWLFLAHSRDPYNKDIPHRQEIRLTVAGEYAAQIYDTLTGEIRPADAQAVGGRTVVRAALYDHDSLLLRLDHAAELQRPAPAENRAAKSVAVPALVDYEAGRAERAAAGQGGDGAGRGRISPHGGAAARGQRPAPGAGLAAAHERRGAAMDGAGGKDRAHRAPALHRALGDPRGARAAGAGGRGDRENLAERTARRRAARGLLHRQEHRHGAAGRAGDWHVDHRGRAALRTAYQCGVVLSAGRLRRAHAGRGARADGAAGEAGLRRHYPSGPAALRRKRRLPPAHRDGGGRADCEGSPLRRRGHPRVAGRRGQGPRGLRALRALRWARWRSARTRWS